MKSKNNPLTASHRKFYKWLSEYGCVVSGDHWNVQIHHIMGASTKSNKQPVGHWLVLPLSYWWHMDPNNPECVDLYKKNFEKVNGSQIKRCLHLLTFYNLSADDPCPEEILHAISLLQ